MYKAAVIGDRETVLGFRALGLTTVAANGAEDASRALHQLAKNDCAIIYITEQLAIKIPAEIAKYDDVASVAVIPIPSKDGSLGMGLADVHRAVEKAVGADILK